MRDERIDPYVTLATAYKALCRQHPNKRVDPDVLLAEAKAVHWERGFWLTQAWQGRTAANVPAERLYRLREQVMKLMRETDAKRAKKFAKTVNGDPQTLADLVPAALAALRWHNQCRAGRQSEAFPLDLTQVRVWLHQHDFPVQAGQLSLFLDR